MQRLVASTVRTGLTATDANAMLEAKLSATSVNEAEVTQLPLGRIA